MDSLRGMIVDEDVIGEVPDLHGVQFEQVGQYITRTVCHCPECMKRRARERARAADEQDRAFTEWYWPEAED